MAVASFGFAASLFSPLSQAAFAFPVTKSLLSLFFVTVRSAYSISSFFSFLAINLCLTVQSIPHLSLKIFSSILTSSSITLSFKGFFSTVMSMYEPSNVIQALFKITYWDIL